MGPDFLIPLKVAPCGGVQAPLGDGPEKSGLWEAIMDIATAKVLELVEYFRFVDAKNGDGGIEGDGDDEGAHLFEDTAGDGTEDQIRGVIEGLNFDEQAELVALVWVGRGDFEAEEWPAAVRRAHERRLRSTAAYVMGLPNAGDLLEEGLAAVGANA